MKTVLTAVLLTFICNSAHPIHAQTRSVDARLRYHRLICIVPMIGVGTAADPRRPDYSLLSASEQGIMAWTAVPSDDGSMAIVELVAKDRGAFAGLLQDKKRNVVAFERGKDSRAVIEAELHKWKKTLNLDRFAAVAQ